MKNFTIKKTNTIKEALKKIESNSEGIICIVDDSNEVIGVAWLSSNDQYTVS